MAASTRSKKTGRNLPFSSKMADICLQIKCREQRDYPPCIYMLQLFQHGVNTYVYIFVSPCRRHIVESAGANLFRWTLFELFLSQIYFIKFLFLHTFKIPHYARPHNSSIISIDLPKRNKLYSFQLKWRGLVLWWTDRKLRHKW